MAEISRITTEDDYFSLLSIQALILPTAIYNPIRKEKSFGKKCIQQHYNRRRGVVQVRGPSPSCFSTKATQDHRQE